MAAFNVANRESLSWPAPKKCTNYNVSHGINQFFEENPAYVGDICYGRRSSGKFSRIDGQDGRPRAAMVRRRRSGELAPIEVRITRNPQAQWTVRTDAHPAVTSRDVFEQAQKKQADRTRYTSAKTYSSPSPLAGLLRCGHCGRPMWLHKTASHHDGKSFTNRYHRCSSYDSRGTRYAISVGGCQPDTTPSEPLERFLAHTIREAVTGEIAEMLAAEIKRQMAVPATKTSNAATLKAELKQIQRQIETATERFLTLDDPNLAAVAKRKLDELSAKAETLKRQLQAAESEKPQSVGQQLQRVLGELDKLAEMLEGEDTRTRQQAYNALVDSITLWLKPAENGRFTLDRGQLKLKAPASVLPAEAISKAGRGNWRSFEPSAGSVAPFVSVFLDAPEPHIDEGWRAHL